MKTFENCYGDLVTDQKEYYIEVSNEDPREDFIEIGDPISLHAVPYRDAVKAAKEESMKYAAVDLCCERWIDDPEMYCGPVTIWRERYEKGKKVWRMNIDG